MFKLRSVIEKQNIKRLCQVFTLMKIETYFIGNIGLHAGIFLNVFHSG